MKPGSALVITFAVVAGSRRWLPSRSDTWLTTTLDCLEWKSAFSLIATALIAIGCSRQDCSGVTGTNPSEQKRADERDQIAGHRVGACSALPKVHDNAGRSVPICPLKQPSVGHAGRNLLAACHFRICSGFSTWWHPSRTIAEPVPLSAILHPVTELTCARSTH